MNTFVRFGLMSLGVIFVFVGIVGIFLPILQGILFLVPGVYLLSITSRRFKSFLEKALSRFPRFKSFYDSHVARFEKAWKKRGGR